MALDQQYLTTVQREYLIMKIDNCISSYYNSLSNGRFYSSRNNNERTDIAVLNRTAMYLGHMVNNTNKGLLLKALFKTLSHNKSKYKPYEYDRLLAEIVISAFKMQVNKNLRTLEGSGVLFLQKGVIGQWKKYFMVHWEQLFV